MQKTILVTGATDGIGLETVKMLAPIGHTILLHGRDRAKLDRVESILSGLPGHGRIASYVADLSRMDEVTAMAAAVADDHGKIDALINNAGVFRTRNPITEDGLDLRFAVNTIAPYLLTKTLLPLIPADGRVINLSSAAQAPVNLQALAGLSNLGSDNAAYAQSKLALTMWSRALALSLGEAGPAIIAVNPRSLLGSKMVKEAYGMDGADLRIGADILCRAALSEEFATASGKYFDNDIGRFTSPHPDGLNREKCERIVKVIEQILQEKIQ